MFWHIRLPQKCLGNFRFLTKMTCKVRSTNEDSLTTLLTHPDHTHTIPKVIIFFSHWSFFWEKSSIPSVDTATVGQHLTSNALTIVSSFLIRGHLWKPIRGSFAIFQIKGSLSLGGHSKIRGSFWKKIKPLKMSHFLPKTAYIFRISIS